MPEIKINMSEKSGPNSLAALAVEAEKFLKAVHAGAVKSASLKYGDVSVAAVVSEPAAEQAAEPEAEQAPEKSKRK